PGVLGLSGDRHFADLPDRPGRGDDQSQPGHHACQGGVLAEQAGALQVHRRPHQGDGQHLFDGPARHVGGGVDDVAQDALPDFVPGLLDLLVGGVTDLLAQVAADPDHQVGDDPERRAAPGDLTGDPRSPADRPVGGRGLRYGHRSPEDSHQCQQNRSQAPHDASRMATHPYSFNFASPGTAMPGLLTPACCSWARAVAMPDSRQSPDSHTAPIRERMYSVDSFSSSPFLVTTRPNSQKLTSSLDSFSTLKPITVVRTYEPAGSAPSAGTPICRRTCSSVWRPACSIRFSASALWSAALMYER